MLIFVHRITSFCITNMQHVFEVFFWFLFFGGWGAVAKRVLLKGGWEAWRIRVHLMQVACLGCYIKLRSVSVPGIFQQHLWREIQKCPVASCPPVKKPPKNKGKIHSKNINCSNTHLVFWLQKKSRKGFHHALWSRREGRLGLWAFEICQEEIKMNKCSWVLISV